MIRSTRSRLLSPQWDLWEKIEEDVATWSANSSEATNNAQGIELAGQHWMTRAVTSSIARFLLPGS